MKITVTLGDMADTDYWDEFCDAYGWSRWCLNEGCDENLTQKITLKEARRWGLLDDDEEEVTI